MALIPTKTNTDVSNLAQINCRSLSMDDQFRGPRTTSLNALDLLRSASWTLLALGWSVLLVFYKVFPFFTRHLFFRSTTYVILSFLEILSLSYWPSVD